MAGFRLLLLSTGTQREKGISMEYTYLDLLCYLLIYSFIGWVVEVLFFAIKDRKLRNRGFFNVPFCLTYGVTMDILIIVLPTMGGHIVVKYVVSTAVGSVVPVLAGFFSKRISRTVLWNYGENNLFTGKSRPFLYGMLTGLVFLTAQLLLHPVLYILINLIPNLIKWIFCIAVILLLVYDMVVVVASLRKQRTREEVEALVAQQQEGKRRLGERIVAHTWRRIMKAYPNLDRVESFEKPVFARGVCFDKLVWVFLIMSVGGTLFEIFFVWLTTGVLMSRSSFIYGPISIVWGCGAVILTILLEQLADRKGIFIFLAGSVLGGIYEYMCSVISEVFFDTTFWDYSDMPLNFGGRTNLLFCLFWGLISIWWVRLAFPLLSKYIEKIPVVIGKVLTWVIFALLILDGLISGAALLRYVDRIDNPEPDNFIEVFIDDNYPDEMLDKVWPNLRLQLD